MSYKVEIIETNNKLEISSSVNEQAPTIDIVQQGSPNISVVHDIALLPSDFNDNTESVIKSFLRSGYGVSLFPSGDYFIVQTSGLQPSGNYSLNGHNHASLDITDFNSSVSGLLPVKNIISGSGISVSSNNSVFTVAVTGQFGLTAEQVDDRINSLLVAGTGISLSYDDFNDRLTISTVGLQPSGNYSVVGHTHLSSNITDFVSAASGAAPVQTVAGKTGNVILNKNDVGLNNVDNTSDLNKPISSATQNALNLKSDVGHVHNSSNITDFASSVSGLLPVKNILSGSGISVTSSGADFTVAVTGQFGLTGEQVDDRVSNLLVAGNYINLNYNDSIDSLTVSVTGVQPSGNYSIVGHSHTIGDVSGLQNSLDSKQPSGNYSIVGHSHNSSDITNFNVSVSGLLPVKNIANGSYVNISNNSGNFIVSVTGLQPSGNYANAIHSHSSSQITDFNSSVSGLLPITNVLAGTNISVIPSGTSYTISVSGQLGLTSEQVDDRVSALLNAGNGININYSDSLDILTISTTGLQPSGDYANTVHSHVYTDITNFSSGVADNLTTTLLPGSFINLDYNSTLDTLTVSTSGLQPSGNYSIVGHSHTNSDITNFNSSVSGLLPSVSGSGYVISNLNNNIYTISVSGLQSSGNYSLAGHTHTSSEITDLSSSVSGLFPVTNITGNSGILINKTGTSYNVSTSGLAYLTGASFTGGVSATSGSFNTLKLNIGNVNNPAISFNNNVFKLYSGPYGGFTISSDGSKDSFEVSDGYIVCREPLVVVNSLLLRKGSSSAPSLVGEYDLSTGFNFDADALGGQGIIDCYSQEVHSFRVSPGGNLSIGTTVPSGRFHVSGVSNFSGPIFASSGNFNSNLRVNNVPVSVSGHTHTSNQITDSTSFGRNILTAASYATQNKLGWQIVSGDITAEAGGQYFISISAPAPSTLTISDPPSPQHGDFYIVLKPSSAGGGISTTIGNTVYSYASGVYLQRAYHVSNIFTGDGSWNNYTLDQYHVHTSANILDFNSSVSGLLPVRNIIQGSYANISNSNGNFTISVTGLQPSGNYSLVGHNHSINDITNLQSSLDLKANLTSPSFSGIPTVPTASSGTNTNQIASTSFVRSEISNLVGSAPSALDTLNELATALGNDPNFATTVTNNLAGKANLTGATFTGSVSAPTGNFVNKLTVNNIDVSINGHPHILNDITNINGNRGDITVASSGLSWIINNSAVTYSKIQNISTNRILGRSSAGSGDIEEIVCTNFARTILDDIDAITARTTLGLTIGTNVQAYNQSLQSISSLSPTNDTFIYATGLNSYTTGVITAFGRSLLDDIDSAASRQTLGLGSISVQNNNNVNISGGLINNVSCQNIYPIFNNIQVIHNNTKNIDYFINITTNGLTEVFNITDENGNELLTEDGFNITTEDNSTVSFVVPNNSIWQFNIKLNCINQTDNLSASFSTRGCIKNTNNILSFIDSQIKEIWKDIGMENADVIISNNNGMQIKLNGLANKQILWGGVLTITELTIN